MKIRMTKQAVWLSCITAFVLFLFCIQRQFSYSVYAKDAVRVPAEVTADKTVVRTKPGQTQEKLLIGKKTAILTKGKSITIAGQSKVSDKIWYHILFKEGGETYSGYIDSDLVKLALEIKADVSTKEPLPVFKKADQKTRLEIGGKEYALKTGRTVTIQKEVTQGNTKWFYISFLSGKNTYKGYVEAAGVTFQENAEETVPSPSVVPSLLPSTEPSPEVSKNEKRIVTKIKAGTIGVVTADSITVAKGAGADSKLLICDGKTVQLKKGKEVTLKAKIKVGKKSWYKIRFSYEEKKLTGYASTSTVKKTNQPAPESPLPSPSFKPLTDIQFESALKSEGFPDSYKAALRELHKQYPLWQFKAYQTGYDWNTAVKKENQLGKNLISNSRGYGWKSIEEGAYDWAKDKFIPFDGSTWMTVSKDALKYYMDPRNFLTANEIFQFEYLSYMPEYQQLSGVESILKNTVMYNTEFTYKDSAGEKQTTTYGETFMDAAAYSQVNPFHLATRVKQEVITSSGFSNSATGKRSGYEGYYNFYNIGATHSTKAGGAVLNGLKFAKTGNGMSGENKTIYMIPWVSPYHAILGGAKYIGNNYINKGQNTVYLQKFNATPANAFSHQYMANVEAPRAEAQKTYTAYKDFKDIPVVFKIPVYKDMPAKKAAMPKDGKNPNNWLKSLDITGQVMEPEFHIKDDESEIYTIMVDATTDYITVNAETVNSKAEISGDGIWKIEDGRNIIKVKVKAENGDVRTYTIYVLRA